MHIGETEGNLGGNTDVDELLPLAALTLDAHEGLVHIGDVNARAHVLARQTTQAAPLPRLHARGVPARTEGPDEVGERAFEDGGAEAIERIADVDQQAQIFAELVDRGEGTHPRLCDQLEAALEQPRNLGRVQPLRECVRRLRGIGAGEVDAVPGRIAGPEAEFAEGGGELEHPCRFRAVVRELRQRREVEPRVDGGDSVGGRQRGKGMERLEGADPEPRDGRRQALAVRRQQGAQTHERIVDVAELRRAGLLVAGDRAHQVAGGVGGGTREARQPDLPQAVPHTLDRRAARADDEHAAVLVHEGPDRVDDSLCSARSGKGGDRDRASRGDLGEHALLLGVGVEQERVGGGRAVIRSDGLHLARLRGERLPVGRVPREGVQHEPAGACRVACHAACNIGERRDDQTRMHREGVDMRSDGPEPVDDPLRFEDAALVSERGERGTVEGDTEVLARDRVELGVDVEAAVQLQLEVGAVATDRERAEQNGSTVRDAADPPTGESDGEVDGLDRANGAQLDVLGRDRLGGEASGTQCDLVAEEPRQQCRLPRNELRQAAGVCVGDVDSGIGDVDELQKRGTTAQFGCLGAQP